MDPFHLGEMNVRYGFDLSRRHELRGGATISGAPAIAVLQEGVVSTKLTVSAMVASGSQLQFLVSDNGAVHNDLLTLKASITLSDGSTLVECGELLTQDCTKA